MDEETRWRYIKDLEFEVRKYKKTLRPLLGPLDPRFRFGTIRKSTKDFPRTYFPSNYHTQGGCVVDIHITGFPWEHCSPDQGRWQVAHECVHLLDPVERGETNFLEEGLATWFQDEPKFHKLLVRKYIKSKKSEIGRKPEYREAKELVVSCLPQLIPAVRKLRRSGKRISEITACDLSADLPSVEKDILERLCTKFPIY